MERFNLGDKLTKEKAANMNAVVLAFIEGCKRFAPDLKV